MHRRWKHFPPSQRDDYGKGEDDTAPIAITIAAARTLHGTTQEYWRLEHDGTLERLSSR